MKRYILSLTVLLLLFGAVSLVKADPILDFVNGTPISPEEKPTVGGWEFNVSSTITVNGLGFWDEGSDGILRNHTIGLWTGDGKVLLASTIITNASKPVGSTSSDGRWLFNDIPNLILIPGSYVLGATFEGYDPDPGRLLAKATTIPPITFVQARQFYDAHSLDFPNQLIGEANDGVFGPNLQTTAPIPEPATMLLFGSGLLALAGFRRKLRK